MTLNYVLKGLNCANCAAKIEAELKKMNELEEATLVFTTKKLKLVPKDGADKKALEAGVRNIIGLIEPGVELVLENDDTQVEEKVDKAKVLRLIISSIFLFLGIFLEHTTIWTSTLLFFVGYLLAGIDVIFSAIKNLVRGKMFDERLLMTIATVGALFLGEYPEAIFVMLFYQVGELFQDYAVGKSRRSIAELMNIKPDYANIKRGEKIVKVAPQEVCAGDYIIVKPGEKIPLDGIIMKGSSSIDTSALTGESLPRDVCEGEEVLSGCINLGGVLEIKVAKEYDKSTVYKILELVQNSAEKKTATENFITRFARWYTPTVVILAVLIVFIPTVVFGLEFSKWLYRALTFLVISCPCALVISVPLSFFGGIGGASKRGVLIKGSNYLEMLANTDTIIFDKTGTLTKGNFEVTKVNPEGKDSKDELVKMAAYAEYYSNHPIAKSLRVVYDGPINEKLISDYKEISGQGISVIVDGNKVLIGNSLLMEKNNIKYNPYIETGTVIYVAINGKYNGYIVISDTEKPDAKQAISKLRQMGIKNLVMLTGDNKKVGDYVADKLGIDKVFSELMPDDKVRIAEEIISQKPNKKAVAFVGDGINDAPVLARCDVGIAMGGLGSDAAIEAADVVIMNDKLTNIATAIKISKKTMSVAKQNIIIALAVKFLVLALGVVGIATMWEAVFADVGVSVIAIINAMRTMFSKED